MEWIIAILVFWGVIKIIKLINTAMEPVAKPEQKPPPRDWPEEVLSRHRN